MSRVRQRAIARSAVEGLAATYTLSQQQIEATADPTFSAKAWLGSADQSRRIVGRPWFVWKDDPNLAREINDRLARGAN